MRTVPKSLIWAGGLLLGLITLLFVASFFIDEPLRKYTEQRMNRHLKGYTVSLPGLDFNPIGFSLTLKDLKITQDENPEPPVAEIHRLKASVQWKALLSGRVVADFLFDRPTLHINLPQLRKEFKDKTPGKERARSWQEAFQAIYPLKVNFLSINDGSFTYIDKDPDKPLRVADIEVETSNIRNIHSRERVYPSALHFEGMALDTGRAVFDGNADFLAEPSPGIKGSFRISEIPLSRFRPVLERKNMTVSGGVASAEGEIEYSEKKK